MRTAAPIALLCLLTTACATTHRVASRTEVVATQATHPELNATAIDHPEKEGVPGVVQAPFEDANLIRIQIPPVLLMAQQAPYARPSPASCSEIAGDVRELDDALGDDFDADQPEDANKDEKHGRHRRRCAPHWRGPGRRTGGAPSCGRESDPLWCRAWR